MINTSLSFLTFGVGVSFATTAISAQKISVSDRIGNIVK